MVRWSKGRTCVLTYKSWRVFVDAVLMNGWMNGITYGVRIKLDNRTRKRKTHV